MTPFDCPVDDMCDCGPGECLRDTKRERDRLALQAELARLERPFEQTLDADERQDH